MLGLRIPGLELKCRLWGEKELAYCFERTRSWRMRMSDRSV
jgi:hypothetical protein